MNTHPVWPKETIEDLGRISQALGWTAKRIDAPHSRWKLISLLLAHAEAHPDLYRKR